MKQKRKPLGKLHGSTCISLACVCLAIGAILWPVSGYAELPVSPEALIQELQDALSSRNLILYSELLSNDFD